jgi:hypothetical protein
MMIPIIAAFAGSLACTAPGVSASCLPVTEVAATRRLTIRKRPSCVGLTRIEKLYSVGIENGIVCMPLSSLVAPGVSPE